MLHGHGAKGAALARLAPRAPTAIRAYTPHGGSLVYVPARCAAASIVRWSACLNPRTDLFLFESNYIAELISRRKIGSAAAWCASCATALRDAEFEPVTPRADATDIVCVGELRPVKGIDVLIEALAHLKQSGRRVTATIAGEGPDAAKLQAQADAARACRSGPLCRPSAGPRGVRHGPHAGHSVARRVAALCGAGSGRRRIAGDRHQGRRHPGNFRAADGHSSYRRTTLRRSPARSRPALDDPRRDARASPGILKARVRSEFSVEHNGRGGLAAYREASRRENLLNSHNQFLKIVHYVAGELPAVNPVDAAKLGRNV